MKLPAALMVALPCAAAFMTPACPPAARYGRDMAVYGSNGRRVDESRRCVPPTMAPVQVGCQPSLTTLLWWTGARLGAGMCCSRP